MNIDDLQEKHPVLQSVNVNGTLLNPLKSFSESSFLNPLFEDSGGRASQGGANAILTFCETRPHTNTVRRLGGR